MQKILCLVFELFEVGANGDVTIGHDGPLRGRARGPLSGKKEVRMNLEFGSAQVDSVLPADG